VASTVAPIEPNCKFSAGVSFRHLINHQSTALTVAIHYGGNGYLAPADRTDHVTLG
jgi:hypothetical protein